MPLDDTQIYKLYKTSADNNALEGITGLLVHDGSVFLQVLEGGEGAVSAMMQRLSTDPRHCDIEVTDERTIERRSFGGWTMKLLKIDRAHMAAVENLDDELGTGVDPAIRTLIVDGLHAISKPDAGHS